MAKIWSYRQDQELPSRGLAWYQRNSSDVPVIIDFSFGWTFTIQLVNDNGVIAKEVADAAVLKAATIPNATIRWPTDTFTNLAPGDYRVHIMARNTASGLDDMFDPSDPPIIRITATPTV